MLRLKAFIVAYWLLGVHVRWLGIPHNKFCRSCKDAKAAETTAHLLPYYPTFGKKILGDAEFIDNVKDVMGVWLLVGNYNGT